MYKILIFLLLSTVATAQTITRSGVASGTDAYQVIFNPPITAFNINTLYSITFTNGNTSGDVSIDPAGVVDTTLVKDNAGSVLIAGAIKANGTYLLRFDGTDLRTTQWVNPPTKNITWITKDANYTPVPADTVFAQVGFLMSSANDLSLTVPSDAVIDFNDGTTFKIRNGGPGEVSILGVGVDLKCTTAGPWVLEEDEFAVVTKLTTNTWELSLFKRINVSESSPVAVFTEYSTVGNVTTGEDVLFSDTLAANTLSTNGNLVSGRFSGIVANNSNGKDIRLSFGGIDIVTRHTTTPTIGQGWVLDWQCIRVDAGNQKCNGTFTGSDGIATAYYVATTADLTADVIIQLTGEATATNDIVKHTASGNFAPGAGSGTTPPPIEPPVIPFVIVDDRTIGVEGYQFNYVSTWATPCLNCAGWYDNTLDYTGTTNAYAEVTFNGTRVQLYTEKHSTHGIFEISLDGVVVDTVDLYSATQQLQQLVFDSNDTNDPDHEEGPLTQDVHTIKMRCTGTKNASSSNYYLILDYVKIENPLAVPVEETPDPPATANNFVKKTGSDGGGNNCNTEGSPCLTIAYALTQMTSGDVLSIGPGTYVETSYLVVTTGETIIGAGIDQTIVKVSSSLNFNGDMNGAKAIFQYTAAGSTAQTISDMTIEGNAKAVHGGIFIELNRNNITMERLKVTNFDYFGIHVAANGHTLKDSQLINCAQSVGWSTGALMLNFSEDFLFDNNDISEANGYCVKAWGGQPIIESAIFRNSEFRVPPGSACCGNANIAFELHNSKPRNTLIENNYFDNSLSIIRPTGFANDGIPSVHIKNNIFDSITKGGGTAVPTAPLEVATHNVEIDQNHFVGGRHAYIVHWNPGETVTTYNWNIHHNTFYATGHINSPTAFVRVHYSPPNGLKVDNNTFHIPPGMNYQVSIILVGGTSVTATNVSVRNNVIYDQSTADTGVGGANTLTRLEGTGCSFTSSTFTYNSVIGMSTTLPSGWTTSNTLTNGPSFIGGGGVNPSPFVYDPFYRPAVGSPLLNSGTDIGYGATPDRGRIQD